MRICRRRNRTTSSTSILHAFSHSARNHLVFRSCLACKQIGFLSISRLCIMQSMVPSLDSIFQVYMLLCHRFPSFAVSSSSRFFTPLLGNNTLTSVPLRRACGAGCIRLTVFPRDPYTVNKIRICARVKLRIYQLGSRAGMKASKYSHFLVPNFVTSGGCFSKLKLGEMCDMMAGCFLALRARRPVRVRSTRIL